MCFVPPHESTTYIIVLFYHLSFLRDIHMAKQVSSDHTFSRQWRRLPNQCRESAPCSTMMPSPNSSLSSPCHLHEPIFGIGRRYHAYRCHDNADDVTPVMAVPLGLQTRSNWCVVCVFCGRTCRHQCTFLSHPLSPCPLCVCSRRNRQVETWFVGELEGNAAVRVSAWVFYDLDRLRSTNS